MDTTAPSFDDVRAAAARIAPHAVRTPVLRSAALDAVVGAQLYFKCENLQRGGAFKFRGACNAVMSLDRCQRGARRRHAVVGKPRHRDRDRGARARHPGPCGGAGQRAGDQAGARSASTARA